MTWTVFSEFGRMSPTNKRDVCSIFSRPGPEGDCHGPRIQYKICENPSCPAGMPTFRDWQCQAFAVRPSYQKHVFQWQAVIDEGKSKL